MNDATEVERIVIRAYGYERFYLRDLPLHKSQKEIDQGENYTDFEFFMRPTIDLSYHLLSSSDHIKVLEPKWLADEIYDMHLQASLLYEFDEE